MHLGGEGGASAFFDISEPEAEQLIDLVDRAVEQHIVIGHVEMAVIVDPARLDPHRREETKGAKKAGSGVGRRSSMRATVADPRAQDGRMARRAGASGRTRACTRSARPPPPRLTASSATLGNARSGQASWRWSKHRNGATQERKAADAVIAALAARYGNRLVTSQAVREQHGHTTTWIANQPPDAVVFPQSDRRGAGDRAAVRGRARAGDRLRHRHLARRPGQCAARRHLPRFPRHEPRARGACRGSRLRHRARHHPQGSSTSICATGRVFPDRSRRRRLARRHGGDARLGHQCGALRHHEGQCAGAQSRARQRRSR